MSSVAITSPPLSPDFSELLKDRLHREFRRLNAAVKRSAQSFVSGGRVPYPTPIEESMRITANLIQVVNGYILEFRNHVGEEPECLVFESKEKLAEHISLYGLCVGLTEEQRILNKSF